MLLFYGLSILFMYGEFKLISSVDDVIHIKKNLKNTNKLNEFSDETKSKMVQYSIFQSIYFIWTFFGLFTKQDVLFLILLIIGVVVNNIYKRLDNLSNKKITLNIGSILSIMVLFIIIFNYINPIF